MQITANFSHAHSKVASAVIQGSKGGSSNQTTPNEDPDDLRSISKAKMLLAISEGEIVNGLSGRNIYLDGTPLVDANNNINFPGVRWDFRPGTVHQSYIKGIPSVENEVSVGTELTSDTPWIRAITNNQLSAVRLRFRWPALQQQQSNGDVTGYRIVYAVDIATDGGSYVTMLQEAVDGKTTQPYERSRRIDLPDGNSWQIRVRRLTPNQNNNQTADTMFITAITDIVDRKFIYPNTALFYIEFDASQFQNIPTASLEPDGGRIIRVPSNYDPDTREYTGVWDGSFKWANTNNPAWITYDIILNDRFSIGRRIDLTMVSKWDLYEIAQYCDQMVPDGKGGTEPRYICDIYIQSAVDAWQLLRDIAAIYCGMSYWAGGQMLTVADMPGDIDFIYTRANIIGTFTYSGNSEKVRYTRALVSWDNPENGYESDVTSVGDPRLQRRYGDRLIELSAYGCTRESEAQRRGKWAILTNNSDRTVSFTAGMDGLIPLPGKIIGIGDNKLAGRPMAGRISAVNGNTITLDRDAIVNVNDRLVINLPSGKAEGRTVQAVTGRDVTVTTAYSEAPQPELQFTIDAEDLAIQLFRVVRIARDGENFNITAVQHDPSKYEHIDTGARIEQRPISVLPIGAIPAPEEVGITQSVLTEQTMAVTVMTLWCSPVENAVAYDFEWRKDNGNWIKIPRTGQSSVDIEGVYTGKYLARVRAVNSAGIASIYATSVLTDIVGKTGAPPAITNLTTTSLVFGIYLNWSFPPNTEDTLRTEIEYAPVASGSGAIKLGDFAYPISNHTMTGLVPGIRFWFRARIVDRTGNEGPWTSWTEGQSSNSQQDYDNYFGSMISESALNQSLQEQINLIPILEAQLAELTGAPEWDDQTAYLAGQIVKFDGGLYRALQDVSAGTPTSDTDYWEKIGDYASLGELVAALAVQVSDLETAVEEIDGQLQATSSRVDTMIAAYREEDGEGRLADAIAGWNSAAAIKIEQRVRASQNEAFAQQTTTLTAAVNSNSSAVQQTSQALATLDGNVQAMWKVSVGVTQDGKYYTSGFGLSYENGPAGLQSQFLVLADRFAVIHQVTGTSTVTAPFVVQGGQVFINTVLIGDATINFAKITDTIQSDNYVANTSGWRLFKDGTFEINSAAGGNRMRITPSGLRMFDGNDIARIELALDLT